ncbi:hypothetical protein BJ123_13110 [Rhodopseudomonas thermotolerans]|uniref:Uncharacterized protein n=2 Tax=Rhodopseudomonas TaxID=1073 RepID=A0A336JZS6_9BRAD|nr:hypothetical protein BJ125_13110 [Rhodopseudomonas pentothenatexigens]REF90372.1 hypothetical protein BJ123_13110 [Rhodopseudomonas thermotolerans]SSW93154.1 hypothetical protein SAMN05892882_13110 [Rhodopseudomonas pentothenatexigens]
MEWTGYLFRSAGSAAPTGHSTFNCDAVYVTAADG